MLTQIYKVSSRNIFIKMLFVFSLSNEYSYFFLRDNFANCSFNYSQVRNTRPPAIAFLKIFYPRHPYSNPTSPRALGN